MRVVILMMIGDLMMDEGPLEEEGIKIEVEGHQIEGIIMIEVTLEEASLMEGPLMEMEDPLMMEDPLGSPRNGQNPRHPGRQGPPGPPGPPGPVRPIIVQQPQVTLDTTALENTFGTVGQSMLQLARAQDQTNRHLQQHLQQGQLNMQAHTGALQQLATLMYQCNFDHIFASIPIYDGSATEKVSFHGWNGWKQPASIVGEISRQKPWVGQQDLSKM